MELFWKVSLAENSLCIILLLLLQMIVWRKILPSILPSIWISSLAADGSWWVLLTRHSFLVGGYYNSSEGRPAHSPTSCSTKQIGHSKTAGADRSSSANLNRRRICVTGWSRRAWGEVRLYILWFSKVLLYIYFNNYILL